MLLWTRVLLKTVYVWCCCCFRLSFSAGINKVCLSVFWCKLPILSLSWRSKNPLGSSPLRLWICDISPPAGSQSAGWQEWHWAVFSSSGLSLMSSRSRPFLIREMTLFLLKSQLAKLIYEHCLAKRFCFCFWDIGGRITETFAVWKVCIFTHRHVVSYTCQLADYFMYLHVVIWFVWNMDILSQQVSPTIERCFFFNGTW